jgi:hypothetical protein
LEESIIGSNVKNIEKETNMDNIRIHIKDYSANNYLSRGRKLLMQQISIPIIMFLKGG